jgi:hypothetical protein
MPAGTGTGAGDVARAGVTAGRTAVTRHWVVRNLTNRRLIVEGRGGPELVLAPLEERVLQPEQRRPFDMQALAARGYVSEQEEVRYPNSYGLAVGLGPWAVIGFFVFGSVSGGGVNWLWAVLLLLLGLPAIFVLANAESRRALRGRLRALRYLGSEAVVLVFAVVVGIGLPGLVLYAGTSLREVIDLAVSGEGDLGATLLTLVGRGMQLVFIAAFSLVPALLYFLADRDQLRTLRERFTREVFRLDPGVETVGDINAKYGAVIEEVYGSQARRRERLLRGRRTPILVATVVITIGWILTLLNPFLDDSSQLITTEQGLAHFLSPLPSVVAFGFLGAYFYALHAAWRSYVRGDLRPKTYSTITVRILTVVILSWVLREILPDGSYLFALAFVTGIVPETALLRIQEYVRGKVKRQLPALTERHPLTNLQGIDLYDRARLADEGMTNVEGLAYSELVELMLKTRIPAAQLVDWTDQAILYIHVGGDDDNDEERQRALAVLRRHGIRTATDLVNAHRAAKKRGQEAEFLGLLPADRRAPGVQPMRVILDAIKDEEWMPGLTYWHSSVHQRELALHVKAPRPASGSAAREVGEEAAVEAGNGLPLAVRA